MGGAGAALNGEGETPTNYYFASVCGVSVLKGCLVVAVSEPDARAPLRPRVRICVVPGGYSAAEAPPGLRPRPVAREHAGGWLRLLLRCAVLRRRRGGCAACA